MVNSTIVAPAASAPAQAVPGGMGEGVWAVHLIGFSLSTCVVIVFICSLRLLLMRCSRHHQEPAVQAGTGVTDEEMGGHQGTGVEMSGQGAPENKEQRVTVMVVQPDAEICCGLQESQPKVHGGEGGKVQPFDDSQAASKLIDAQSQLEQAGRTRTHSMTSRQSA